MDHNKVKQKRNNYELFMKSLMLISTLVTGLLVIFLIAYVFVKGLPNLSIEFLTTKPSYCSGNLGYCFTLRCRSGYLFNRICQ